MKIEEGSVIDIQKEREAFNSWFKREYIGSYNLSQDGCEEAKTRMDYAYVGWIEAKLQAVPEGFVLVQKEPTKDTLIEIASVCIGDDFANLDEAKELYKAAIKAQEPAND